MKKLRILLDLDAILVDLLSEWLAWYNQQWKDNLTIEDITSWHIHDHVKCGNRIYEFFRGSKNYEKAKVIPGAAKAVRALHEDGHEIFIVSASSGSTAKSKHVHVGRVAEYLPSERIILAHRKDVVKGDVFIDDSPDNLRAYRAAWPAAKVMTIAYPYNRPLKDQVDVFAESYAQPEQAWEQIYTAIQKHAAVW